MRRRPIYKRRRATPMPASALIGSRALVGVVTSLVIAAVLVAIGWALPSRLVDIGRIFPGHALADAQLVAVRRFSWLPRAA